MMYVLAIWKSWAGKRRRSIAGGIGFGNMPFPPGEQKERGKVMENQKPLDNAEAIELINKHIPAAIREEMGGFSRAFQIKYKDGRAVSLIQLERGYLVHFFRPELPPRENTDRGIYVSPEGLYGFGLLMALFSREGDETAFWEHIDPEQRTLLKEAFAGTGDEELVDGLCPACGFSLDLHYGDGSCPSPEVREGYPQGKPPHIPLAEADEIAAEVANAPEDMGMFCDSCKMNFRRVKGGSWDCPHCGSLCVQRTD
jgi:hypothetical protein